MCGCEKSGGPLRITHTTLSVWKACYTRPVKRLPLWAVGLTAVAIAAACTSTASGDGLEVPNFTVSAYQGADELGGREVELTKILDNGKPLVLNFWAALCPPCRAEMTDIQQVYEARGHEVTVLGIDIGPFVFLGSRDEGKALIEELELSYPAGTTFDQEAIREIGILGMPTTIFLKPNGEVQRKWTGFLTEDKFNELIDKLVAEA